MSLPQTPQQPVRMERCVWLGALCPTRGGWRSVLTTSGEQCVMMSGTQTMQLWSAGSWTSPVKVIHTPQTLNKQTEDFSISENLWSTRNDQITLEPRDSHIRGAYVNQQWMLNWGSHSPPACSVILCLAGPLTGALAAQRGFFGRGIGQIHLDQVQCSGTELTLQECPHGGVGVHNCFHSEDAGVVCFGRNIWFVWMGSKMSANACHTLAYTHTHTHTSYANTHSNQLELVMSNRRGEAGRG